MLESILVETTEAATLTMQTTLLCSLVSIVLGIVIAFAYMLSSKHYSQNYVGTLVILPILVQVVIMMVNGNLGTGVAILGAFSLVRFRSIPGRSKEISGVFFAMAIESACIPLPSEIILPFTGYMVFSGHFGFWLTQSLPERRSSACTRASNSAG